MRRKIVYFFLIVAVCFSLGHTQKLSVGKSNKKDELQVVKMTVSPADEPRTALKYQFFPNYLDQTCGNAALLYNTAVKFLPDDKDKMEEKINDWLDMSPEELPVAQVQQTLDQYREALHQLNLATHREHCDWQIPIRSEGFAVMLGHLGDTRRLAKVLALKIRLQILQGKHDEVVSDLQNGFVMGRQVAEGYILVADLVGMSIAKLMLKQVEQLIQQSDAPNYYWALTDLPQPFIDMYQAMHFETVCIYNQFPQLRHIRTAQMTSLEAFEQYNDIFVKLYELCENSGIIPGRLITAGDVLLNYQDAKNYLLQNGVSLERVQGIPAAQAVLIYQLEQYDYITGKMFKWFSVPYWQGREGVQQAEQYFEKQHSQNFKTRTNPFLAFLPALGRAYFLGARLDRHIAALRCVEALRMYAAEHGGKLPATLGEITKVPIPLDPTTGNEFEYRVDDGNAVIESPAPAGYTPRYGGLHYEITIKK